MWVQGQMKTCCLASLVLQFLSVPSIKFYRGGGGLGRHRGLQLEWACSSRRAGSRYRCSRMPVCMVVPSRYEHTCIHSLKSSLRFRLLPPHPNLLLPLPLPHFEPFIFTQLCHPTLNPSLPRSSKARVINKAIGYSWARLLTLEVSAMLCGSRLSNEVGLVLLPGA